MRRTLVRLAKELGYETVVIDGRAAFATEARFPDVDRLVVVQAAAAGKAPNTIARPTAPIHSRIVMMPPALRPRPAGRRPLQHHEPKAGLAQSCGTPASSDAGYCDAAIAHR